MPAGVDELGALRVVPGGEPQRVGEVEVDGRPFLGDPRREGHVVPGGVAAEHALVEAELGGEGPLGDGEGGDADREQQEDRLHLRGFDFAAVLRRFAPADPGGEQADADADEDRPADREDAERAEQLEREDEQGDGDRHVGEPRQRPGELGHDPAPQPVAAEADGGEDADQREAAAYIGAEGGGHRRGMVFAAAGRAGAGPRRAPESGRRRRCPPDRSSRSAPCGGTAGGSPRRSRRAPPARPRW